MSVKFVFRELTLAAGARKRVNEIASFFMLVSDTGTKKIRISIDNDPLSDCPVGYEYREGKEDSFYKHIDFMNPNGAAVTIEYIMSSGLVRGAPVITGLKDIWILLQECLDAFQGQFDPALDGTEKTVGLAAVEIRPSEPLRRAGTLQSKSTNTGIIYLGFTNAVTTTRWFKELQPGQSWTVDDYRGIIFAISDTADQKLGWGVW